MTEKEKMLAHQMYDANYNRELHDERIAAKELCWEYNQLRPSNEEGQRAVLKKLLGKTGENFYITAPFWCDYGYNIELGENFYANHNLVILDCAKVKFGDNVFVAPDCGFHTAGHPIDFERRNAGFEYAYPITVGDNVWIGAGVQVMPGVTIGSNVVIGGGSAVNGNPVYGSFTPANVSAIITYGVQILSSLMMAAMIMVMFTMSVESAKRITEVLECKSDLVSPENGLTEVKDGSISFENVSFKYSKEAEKFALSDINLQIKSGETVGILGGTGSSKTSLIQLIPRLYDVSEGAVKVGGEDVRKYDLEALRNQVSVVLQKNVLFSGTIKENLRWGNEHATDEELVAACKAAQADEFISQFPDKYDTYIEQGGTNVSGGQKQRLCIARALLKKPKILILDDSTSAVDTKTDALIRAAFLKEIPGTTKIIIAQRVASVEEADKIIVMDGGKIAACGTHDELMQTSEIYREVYESQTRGKTAEDAVVGAEQSEGGNA